MFVSGKEWERLIECREYKNMLIGEYTHAMDPKNRISLPAKWRKSLGKKVVLSPGLDNCIFLFTEKEWSKVSDKISENASLLSSDMRSFTRFMYGGAFEAEVDSIGRILIPDFLRERSGLKGKAIILGVDNRAEIWNEEAWKTYKAQVEKGADDLAEKLSGLGIM